MSPWLILALVLAWHALLWTLHRAYVRHTRIEFWAVGHKLGRVSGMIGPEQTNRWLEDAGIDPKLLPKIH